LGGQGADEMMGGYARHLLLLFELALKDAIWDADDNKAYLSLRDMITGLPQLRNYGSLMSSFFSQNIFGEPSERFYQLIKRTDSKLSEILNRDVIDETYSPFEEFKSIFNKVPGASPLDKILN